MSKDELDERPLGPLMVDVGGTALTPEDISVIENPLVGGIILFARNLKIKYS